MSREVVVESKKIAVVYVVVDDGLVLVACETAVGEQSFERDLNDGSYCRLFFNTANF